MGLCGSVAKDSAARETPATTEALPEVQFKLIFCGDALAGKTALIHRIANDAFDPSNATVLPEDRAVRKYDHQGRRILLMMVDSAGQERFRTLTSSYYRGANAIGLVFDLTSGESFFNVESWRRTAMEQPDVYIFLVGAKADLVSKRVVLPEAITELVEKHGNLKYFETSALTGDGTKALLNDVLSVAAKRARGKPPA